MRKLVECLLDHDSTLLRAIAERRGVELGSGSFDEKVEMLAAALLNPDSITETLEWLSDEEREAIDALLLNGGQMRAHLFALRFGEIRRFGPGSLARQAPWRAPANPAEGLWYRGLIARAFADREGTAVEFVFIPSDLLSLLPPPPVGPVPFDLPAAADPYRVAAGDPALIDDLCTLLSMAQAGSLHLVHGGYSQETFDQLSQRLLEGDRARVDLMSHLARSADLMYVEGRKVRLNRERVRLWLKESRAQQLREMQATWLEDASWNDLCHVPGLRCEETGWRNDPLLARRAVLDLLRRCAVDSWVSIPGFVQVVRDRAPDYARPDGDFESWYIRDARSGEYLAGFEHWDQVEGALLVYLLAGPLHWLGVVSLGYKEGWEKPSAFQITPWGGALLGLAHAVLEDLPSHPALVAPDGTVTLAREAPLSDRFQLARIADWRASGATYAYAITPTSLGRALSAGIEVERIERFLARISEGSVPAAAVLRLRSWAERYGRVRLRRVVILETRTPQLMAELRAQERIRGYLRQAVSPTVTLVRESDWDLLLQELHRAGYLPEILER
jgi:hypothetical protein